MTTFSKRAIDLSFTLGKGSFGADGSDTIDVKGFRCSASITKAGGVTMSTLSLRVWGMTLEVMNKLTILGTFIAQNSRQNNTVTVSAGDEDAGMAVVFAGTMTECWIDTNSAPQVSLVVSAFTGFTDALKPAPPTSYKGTVDAVTVMSGIAKQLSPPLPLENSGVMVTLSSPYYPGTLRAQALACAQEGQFNILFDDNALAIWPNGGVRDGLVPLVSPDTGMIGYPVHTQAGIQVRMLYNPSIRFGGTIKIDSSLVPAIGDTWTPHVVTHDLEAEMPGGKWFTTIECYLFGTPSYQG